MAGESMSPIVFTIGTMMLAIILHLLSFLLFLTLSNVRDYVNRLNLVQYGRE